MIVCFYHVMYVFQSESRMASLAKWLSVHLQTKWLLVQVPLQSLSIQCITVLHKTHLSTCSTCLFTRITHQSTCSTRLSICLSTHSTCCSTRSICLSTHITCLAIRLSTCSTCSAMCWSFCN